MTADITIGLKIYRPAHLEAAAASRQLVLENPSMQDFGDGTVMLRARPAAAGAPGWQVVPWEEPGGRICVCDEPIPADWIYFEVLFADVNFVAVTPVAGSPEELRRRLDLPALI